MSKQSIFFYFSFFLLSVSIASPPDKKVFVAPSPSDSHMQDLDESSDDKLKGLGLDSGATKKTSFTPSSSFHLRPTDSLTLAFGPGYEVSEETDWWLGLHYSPWMDALTRWQFGVDVHGKTGWFQTALHFFGSRNRDRLYAGPGVSLLYRSEDRLASFSEIENYFLFVAAGGEKQILRSHSLRVEFSYHVGTETEYLRGIFGYTYYF